MQATDASAELRARKQSASNMLVVANAIAAWEEVVNTVAMFFFYTTQSHCFYCTQTLYLLHKVIGDTCVPQASIV